MTTPNSPDSANASTHDQARPGIRQPRPRPQPVAPLKLSEDRRQKLLAHFKTPAPERIRRTIHAEENSWLIPLAASIALLAILAGLLLPAISASKSKSFSRESFSEFERPLHQRTPNGRHRIARLQVARKLVDRNASAALLRPWLPLPNQCQRPPGKTVIVLPAADPTATPPLALVDENGKKVFA